MGGLLTVIVSYDVLECFVTLIPFELIGRLVDNTREFLLVAVNMCAARKRTIIANSL